jgi:hypothetical protein
MIYKYKRMKNIIGISLILILSALTFFGIRKQNKLKKENKKLEIKIDKDIINVLKKKENKK